MANLARTTTPETDVRRAIHRISAAPLAVVAIVAVSACAVFQDPEPNAEIEAAFPPAPGGAQLMDEDFQDGKWRGDQPPASTDRRWLVDCTSVDADVASIEQYFLDEGFVDDVDPNFSVLRYRRPSDDLRAGVESDDEADIFGRYPNSEGLSRDEVDGKCLVWVLVEASD